QRGTEPARRVDGGARERAEDHDVEAQREPDRQRRPFPPRPRIQRDGADREDEQERPDPLDDRAEVLVPEDRADRRRPVVARTALVEQKALDEQRAEDAAGELSEDVHGGIDRVDAAEGRRGEGHYRVAVTAGGGARGGDRGARSAPMSAAHD